MAPKLALQNAEAGTALLRKIKINNNNNNNNNNNKKRYSSFRTFHTEISDFRAIFYVELRY